MKRIPIVHGTTAAMYDGMSSIPKEMVSDPLRCIHRFRLLCTSTDLPTYRPATECRTELVLRTYVLLYSVVPLELRSQRCLVPGRCLFGTTVRQKRPTKESVRAQAKASGLLPCLTLHSSMHACVFGLSLPNGNRHAAFLVCSDTSFRFCTFFTQTQPLHSALPVQSVTCRLSI